MAEPSTVTKVSANKCALGVDLEYTDSAGAPTSMEIDMIENIQWFPSSETPDMKESYPGGPLTSGQVLIKMASGTVTVGSLGETYKTRQRRWEIPFMKGVHVSFWAYLPKGPGVSRG